MIKPLRPSLRFISKLPTIKIREEVETTNMVIWKVELDKPVDILVDGSYLNLNIFYIGAMTLKRFSKEKGEWWHYDMKIGIKRDLENYAFIISPRDEEWYLNNKWWKWA